MGVIEKVLGMSLIGEVPDRHCNRVLVEKTPHNYHFHFRNLKVELTEEEIRQWVEAFGIASKRIEEENLLDEHI